MSRIHHLFLLTCSLLTLGCTAVANTSSFADGDTVTDYFKEPIAVSEVALPHTRYDYSSLAAQITDGCSTNFEKIRAIYKWICDHISYDTSYKVRTPDECLDKQKGVCQAYCELFYVLARAVGVKVEIVSGIAKNHIGEIGKNGHSWLFAYTREKHGIFLDPTWGAGAVVDGEFIRAKDCWAWFNTPPEWLILSHYPKNKDYQLLQEPMTELEFRQLQPVSELWMTYGLDLKDIYRQVRARTLSLPIFFPQAEGELKVLDFPLRPTVRIGETLRFRMHMLSQRDFTLLNNHISCKRDQWTDEGNGVYSVEFMPRDTSTLNFCLRDPSNQYWNCIVKYEVAPPTPADWQRVEQAFPLSAPDLQKVKNLDAEKWKRAGVDGERLLQEVRKQHITELPILFEGNGQQALLDEVPLSKQVPAGQPCTFRFRPQSGIKWAIVNNAQWHHEWEVSEDGLHAMTITPEAGTLFLYVQMEKEQPYWAFLEYEVK